MTSRTPRQPLPEQVESPARASPGPAEPAARGARLAAVDMLRLVAALAVASFHYLGTESPAYWGTAPTDFASPVHRMSMYGWLGVEAFFLISGFVICMSAWGRTPGQFAVSRLSRLYPAYWCALALVVLCMAVTVRGSGGLREAIAPRVVAANLTMAPGALHVEPLDGVAWTLWVEARFYLLMAVVLAFGFTYHRMLGFCTVWLGVAAAGAEMSNRVVGEIALTDYAGLFVAGIAVYLMYRFGQNLLLWMVLGLAWLFQLSEMYGRSSAHVLDTGSTQHTSWLVCTVLLTGFLALLMLATIGPLAKLQWRWLVTGGALTYPFYLVHQSIGVPMGKELSAHVSWLGPWSTVLLTLGSMLLLARLMNGLVEKPFGKLMRKHLAKGLNPPRVRAEAEAARAKAGAASA
ncbi:acyltransferase family protein [Actinacidiphila paucisporea]|nr:acyltransferase [Actinacidiphila paucisporea]